MTRRALLTLPAVLMTPSPVMAAGLHVSGTLTDDTSDLQSGYYALCGTGTAHCKAIDAIGISIHPNNALYGDQLRSMVGRTVQVSIFATP